MPIEYSHEETLDDGLRYAETQDYAVLDLIPNLRKIFSGSNKPTTFCLLWAGEAETPVSFLLRHRFPQRFGRVAVPVEGYGAVSTAPQHRRKGYIARLIRVRPKTLFGHAALLQQMMALAN